MIKKIGLTLGIIAIFANLHAQEMVHQRSQQSCRPLYMGLSSGLENQNGIIGFNLDVPVAESVSVGGGIGLSSWGYKAFGECRYYFKSCHRGWAIGAGLTYNTGLPAVQTSVPEFGGNTTDVTLDLNPSTNGFIAGYHFFNLGRTGHRFYLEAGYSIPFKRDNYSVLAGGPLDATGESFMTLLQPGGLILALGFSFGVGGN